MDTLKRRVLRYFILIVVFSLIYYAFLAITTKGTFELSWFFTTIYTDNSFSYSGAYWFLYIYLGFLISLPLQRLIAKHADRKILIYTFIIYLIFASILPVAERILHIDKLALDIPFMCETYFMYPMLGYFVENNKEELYKKKSMIFIGIMSVISIVAGTMLTLHEFKWGNVTEAWIATLQMFLAAFIYIIIKYFCDNHRFSQRTEYLLKKVGGATLGIFLLHGYFMTWFDNFKLSNNMYSYGFSLVEVLVVFVLSGAATLVLQKIPFIKKAF